MERRHRRPRPESGKIDGLVKKIREELSNSIEPISLSNLNSFERKLVHRAFDHNPDIVTKTYRSGEEYEMRVYPVGNLKRFADEKAEEAIESREPVSLPPMNSYERFVIHDYLKTRDEIKSTSEGEGDDRHIVIEPNIFGRGLKKMIRKIRFF